MSCSRFRFSVWSFSLGGQSIVVLEVMDRDCKVMPHLSELRQQRRGQGDRGTETGEQGDRQGRITSNVRPPSVLSLTML